MLEAYTTLGYLAARHRAGRAARLGHGGHLPRTRAAGQGGHHARRAVRRPGLARHRRRLERGGARRARAAVPAAPPSGSSGSRRRCRSACRCGRDDDEPVRRQALPARPHAQLAAAAAAPAPADPDRRRRREEDAAAGGAVRRRLQPLRRARSSRTSSTCCAGTARTLGRDYDEIEKTVLTSCTRDEGEHVDEILEQLVGSDAGRDSRHMRGSTGRRAGWSSSVSRIIPEAAAF